MATSTLLPGFNSLPSLFKILGLKLSQENKFGLILNDHQYLIMNRRSSLRQLLVGGSSFLVLPVWAQKWDIQSMQSHHSSFSQKESETLSSIADTIIPSSDGKMGAKTVGVDLFLQKLFDRCYEKEINDNIKYQLAAIDQYAINVFGNKFDACSAEQRITLLQSMGTSSDKKEKDFFDLVKSETIRGFNTSEPVMIALKYKVAPGHYYGCVDANT